MKKKALITLAGVATLVGLSTAPAFADAPNGSFNFKGTNSHGNCVGVFSSQITQNGQFVSGHGAPGYDQTTYPGSRADLVHQAQQASC